MSKRWCGQSQNKKVMETKNTIAEIKYSVGKSEMS